MRNFIATFLKFFVVILILGGAWLLFKSGQNTNRLKVDDGGGLSVQANILRKHLMKYSSPQKVQINNLTQRLSSDVEEIKKIKIPLKPDAPFYISIDLFTDEHDTAAMDASEVDPDGGDGSQTSGACGIRCTRM